MLDKNKPWQLYTFSAVFWLGSIAMYGPLTDPYHLVTGKSAYNKGAEEFLSRSVAVGLLCVSAFFFTLTHINRDNAPKLKRLANMSMMCVMALLTSLIFIGPRSQGGLGESILHFLTLISTFALLAIMQSAVGDSSDMVAPTCSPFEGHGANPKSYMFFLAMVVFFKLVDMSELLDPSMFLTDTKSVTAYSQLLWQFMIVIMLMILFPITFALAYGDHKDHEAVTGVTIIMMIISVMSYYPIKDQLVKGIMTMAPVSGIVIFFLGIMTICISRSSAYKKCESITDDSVEDDSVEAEEIV